MITGNYLSASGLILERLKAKITDIPAANFRVCPSLEWAAKNALAPSINVIFLEDQALPDGQAGRGRIQKAQQDWLIIYTAHNVTDVAKAILASNGEIILRILRALQGYTLSAEHQPLIRRPHPFRKGFENGYLHYPFMFSTDVTVDGDKD